MKRVISFFVMVTIFASLFVFIPITNVSAGTISDEDLFMNYPSYLSNGRMQNGLNKATSAYHAVINSYSKTDETVAAYMTAMSEGISFFVKEGLSYLGIGQNYYDTQVKEAVTNYMKSMLSDENVIKKASSIVEEAYKSLKTSYSISSSVDKTTMMADLVKISRQYNISIDPDDMDDLVNDLYGAKSIGKDLAAIGEANKLWKIVFGFTELHAIEKTTMSLLMDELSKSGQKNSDLYLGLSLLKKDIEKDSASYVLKYYATDTAISYLADKADELMGTVTSANALSLVTTCMKVFADYIYVNAKADDITKAIMQTSFVSNIDICLSQYRLKFIQGKGTVKDIETYEILYGAYLAAYKTVLDTCYDISKINDKFSLGGDCVVCRDELEYDYTYKNYIKWCKEEVIASASGASGGGFRGETDNAGSNDGSLGNSIVGIVDIPSSWENLSIRSGPSTNYQIVGSMNDGARCNVYPDKAKNGWYYIEYNGVYGYASGSQINISGSSATPTPTTPTPKPSTPATISLSKSSINLDIPSKRTDTVEITLSGTLPSRYRLDFDCSSSVQISWGGWTNNSKNNSLTITATDSTQHGSTATIFLRDDDGNTYATATIPIRITTSWTSMTLKAPSSVGIDYVNSPTQKITVEINGRMPSTTLQTICNSSVSAEMKNWNGKTVDVYITANYKLKDIDGNVTLQLVDENNSVMDSTQITVYNTTPVYSISYNVDGGYYPPEYPSDYVEKQSRTQYKGIYTVIEIISPQKEGYKFLGWSRTPNETKPEYRFQDKYDEYEDVVLYAVWEKLENLFDLEFERHSIHDDSFEAFEYYIDGDRFWIDDIVFQCDKNIECNWDMAENEDGSHSIILQIIRNGDISSHELSFDVVNEDGYVLFSDILSVFENYNKEQFPDRNVNGITVYVDGEKIDFDVQPRLINNRTMVPMRAIFEALGAQVDWDGARRTAIGETRNRVIEITIGNDYLLKNNSYVSLDSPAVIIGGRTLVPVRAIAESFDCKVEWIGDLQVVNITS